MDETGPTGFEDTEGLGALWMNRAVFCAVNFGTWEMADETANGRLRTKAMAAMMRTSRNSTRMAMGELELLGWRSVQVVFIGTQ